MPPYGADIQRAIGPPVFDIVSLVTLVQRAVRRAGSAARRAVARLTRVSR